MFGVSEPRRESRGVPRRLAVLSATVLAAAATWGCAAEPEDSGTSSDSSSPSSSASSSSSAGSESATASPTPGADADVSPAPADEPFVANTEPDTGQADTDGTLVLAQVRYAAQSGYDRVVLEYSGTGLPGWDVQYVDAASRQGTGEPIVVPGGAFLRVAVNGTTYPQENQPALSSGAIGVTTTTVTGIFVDGNFEGMDQLIVGVKSKQPFRVFAVANPPRLVIDVQS